MDKTNHFTPCACRVILRYTVHNQQRIIYYIASGDPVIRSIVGALRSLLETIVHGSLQPIESAESSCSVHAPPQPLSHAYDKAPLFFCV